MLWGPEMTQAIVLWSGTSLFKESENTFRACYGVSVASKESFHIILNLNKNLQCYNGFFH
jgi:hypothetical protein